jgi:diguanylate cyclase (GGDEF)-like protein
LTFIWVLAAVLTLAALWVLVRLIRGLEKADEQLQIISVRDPLSNLRNRGWFVEQLDMAIEKARRHKDYMFAVLFVDLDRFKIINDSLGHNAGDEVIIAVSRILMRTVRPHDTVARLGGDEFAILLDSISHVQDATIVAGRINEELNAPIKLTRQEVFTSASIGITLSTTRYNYPNEVLRDADTAMYRAKSQGRARYVLFDDEMHKQAMERLELDTDIRKALKNECFKVLFQPIIKLSTGRITAMEALVRWEHETKGLLSPKTFIPLAEETGLIVPLGQWILQESCQRLREWKEHFQGEFSLCVNVNLSIQQFVRPGLAEVVQHVLDETGIEAGSLQLGIEVSEKVLLSESGVIAVALKNLHDAGVRLCIDDFGTGYSSLNVLHKFHVDTLKIDRTFISNMTEDPRNKIFVKTIVSLAHNLEMDVIAEGVETKDEMDYLKSLGCEYAQGFYFSKPIAPAAMNDLLAKNPQW